MYNFAEYGFATLTNGNTTWWPSNVLSLAGIAEKVVDNLVVLKKNQVYNHKREWRESKKINQEKQEKVTIAHLPVHCLGGRRRDSRE